VNQNQFDALVSFCYNLGIGAFNSSTLKKKVIANPADASIRDEFMKWNKARVKGVLTELKGLTNRRTAEADLYFKI
jgi:lysozyme